MKKLSLIFSALLIATALHAGEHSDAAHGLEYSVFRNYTFAPISNPTAVYNTQRQAAAMFPGWNATVNKLSSRARDMYGPAVSLPGGSNKERAISVLNNQLKAFEVDGSQWTVVRDAEYAHAGYVDLAQNVAGHDVIFSHMSFRFTTDGRLVRIKMHHYGNPDVNMQPVITQSAAKASPALTTDLQGINGANVKMDNDWVWFPVPAKGGYELHPAWTFTITGTGAHEMPVDYLGYIDAMTGELLYRTNRVHETFEVTVKGEVYGNSPLQPTSVEPMPSMRVFLDGTQYFTDDTGYINASNKNVPINNANISLQGPWVRVVDNGNGNPSFNTSFNTSGSTFQIATGSNNIEVRHLTTFYHVNVIHDYLKGHFPSFTGMDNALTANLDRPGNTCNAFYNGSSINFFNAQSNCRAFSEVSDIIYHEYGHGINYTLYQDFGATFSNGAMGEANSDVWSMVINKDGVVGEGAFTNGGAIRSYVGQPKIYPQDIVGEVHADGEILAGAWWDVSVNTGSVDTMANLFALTQYDVPMAPNGMEGEAYHEVLISAIMNDDDDNNLANGTPHFTEIVQAFARHGIYLLQGAEFEHTEVAHQQSNTAVTISGKLTVTNPAFFDKLYLIYRNRYGSNNNWDSVVMVNTTGNTYTAQLPGQSGGSIMDYYFSAADVVSVSAYGLPEGFKPGIINEQESTIPYQFGFGINNVRYKEDFEGNLAGWMLGGTTDNATSGQWVHEVPIATNSSGEIIQTGSDHTTGSGKCLVTGNSASFQPGFADVDNGATTAMTPLFEVPFFEPVIEYYRWYSNDRGTTSGARNDYWKVEVRATESTALWRRVDYTKQADRNWRRRIFRLSEYLGTAPSVQVRFTAEDRVQNNLQNNGQDIVEAAVDDFIIYEGAPVSVDNMPEDMHTAIYPNPADNIVNITVPQGSKGTVSLYDLNGKILQTADVTEAKVNYTFSTTGLAAGTYMILVQTQYAVQNSKVVIVH